MQRATRNRGNNSPNLDGGSSSITTQPTYVDQSKRGQLTGRTDPNRTISLGSEDDPATECSFEYDDDGELRYSIGDSSEISGSLTRRRRKDAVSDDDRPTTLRGLERLSTDTDEFGENESSAGPEDVDLESFKRVYMTDFVIPEEPDKESAANQLETQLNGKSDQQDPSANSSEGSKWRRRFRLDGRNSETINSSEQLDNSTERDKNEGSTITTDPQTISESDLNKPMSISDIERFVQVTCDEVMSRVREEGIGGGGDTDEESSVRGSGIFKVRPGLRFDDSMDSRASTDATLSTIEIPTITITEDQLDDSSVVLSEATLRDDGSEYDRGELPEDGGSNQSGIKGKATALKSKVKKLGSKVKDIFKRGTTPEVSPSPSPVGEYIDIDEEKRRRKEEEKEAERKRKEEEAFRKEETERKRRDEELEKRALEMERKAGAEIAKERERLKKEEAKRQKEEEKRRKEEEERLRKEEEKARKEEEKARKEEEKRLKAEEKKRREEEEMRRKEEEKMKKKKEEEEKRIIQEEEERKRTAEERKRQIEEEEEARKRWAIEDAEKRRRWIEEEAEKTRIAFEQEQERKRKQKEMEEEEAERRRKREAEEEEKRRKMEEEQEERRKKREEEEAKSLKRKLEDEVTAGNVAHEDNQTNLDQVATTVTAIEANNHDGFESAKDDIRRASSPSLASGQVSVAMSKSTSQVTIMMTSQGNRDKRSPSRDEETFGQAEESEGDIEPHMGGRKRKKMRKRLRDTKNKLINLKSKALESLPSMSSLKSRVKEILPARGGTNTGQGQGGQFDEDPYSIHREQKIFSEYRKRYPDSENEFFSDSELVESRKSTLKAMSPDLEADPGGMYDDIDTTEDRVQMLLSPINSPLRPPRKSDYSIGGMGSSFHTSEPNISRTGTPKKPKRAPPPRPPPPEVDNYLISSTTLAPSITGSTTTSLGALEEIDLTSSTRDLSGSLISIKKEPERVPASIYYRKVVRDWQERHLKKLGREMVSASSPNLETYQRPLRPGRHPPRIPPLPLTNETSEHPKPLPRRRLSRTGSLRQKMIEQQKVDQNKENAFYGYEVLGEKQDRSTSPGSSGLPPLPPPRLRADRLTPIPKSPYSTLHRRKLQLQQQQLKRQIQHDYLLTTDRAHLATDGLYWKPFSWKTGRCRSLTELYVRKRAQPSNGPLSPNPLELGSNNSLCQESIERSLSYRLMSQYCSPPRPPPPTIRAESPSGQLLTEILSPDNGYMTKSEPIYSTIDRSKKLKRDFGHEETLGSEIQSRPLPAPPLPPRSKRKNSGSRSRSNSPYLSLNSSSVDLNRPEATFIRPVSPYPSAGMVDVSVETGSQLVTPSPLESKECQTSLENIEGDKQSVQTNDNNLRLIKDAKETHLAVESAEGYFDDDCGRESITPTPATIAASSITKSQVAIRVTPDREVICVEAAKQPNDVSTTICQLKRTRLSSSSSKDSSPPMVTANSGQSRDAPGRLDDEGSNRTLTSYYDAEECDTDMDTFADLDSLSTEATATLTASSQFHSVHSEPLTTISSSTTSHYDTDEAESKTMEIPLPPSAPAPPIPEKEADGTTNVPEAESSIKAVPLVAEHVTIEEDSDDEMFQPRVASPNEMRAYISRRRMRPDSMDASDPEW